MGNENGKRDWGCLQERLKGHRMVKETRRQGLSQKYTLLEMIMNYIRIKDRVTVHLCLSTAAYNLSMGEIQLLS